MKTTEEVVCLFRLLAESAAPWQQLEVLGSLTGEIEMRNRHPKLFRSNLLSSKCCSSQTISNIFKSHLKKIMNIRIIYHQFIQTWQTCQELVAFAHRGIQTARRAKCGSPVAAQIGREQRCKGPFLTAAVWKRYVVWQWNQRTTGATWGNQKAVVYCMDVFFTYTGFKAKYPVLVKMWSNQNKSRGCHGEPLWVLVVLVSKNQRPVGASSGDLCQSLPCRNRKAANVAVAMNINHVKYIDNSRLRA